MNFLDENIPENQRLLLCSWRIRVHQIGREVGKTGMKDSEIITVLQRKSGVTFFTRDIGFFHRNLCHSNYCLVCLTVGQYETASFIRRFLRHTTFNTSAKRMGKVVRVSHGEIRILQSNIQEERKLLW